MLLLDLEDASLWSGWPIAVLEIEARIGRLKAFNARGLWVVSATELNRWMLFFQSRN